MHSADIFSDEDYCSDDVSSPTQIGDANVAAYLSDAWNSVSPKWNGGV
jgi:hypothetical protein